jgi:hypothetical protein
MYQPGKLVVVALMAAALSACSTQGSSIPAVQAPSGPQSQGSQMASRYVLNGVHIMLPRGAYGPDLSGQLNYNGGPIEKHPKVFVVYWGFKTDPTHEQPYLHRFLKGLGGSRWLATDKQYYETARGHILNPVGQLKGEWNDNSAVPSQPTDSDVINEAERLVTHVGFDQDASYVVATPHNHNTGGFGSQFCAYHGAFSDSHGVVAYTNLPYMTDAGGNCGENIVNPGPAGVNDGVSIVEGHELAETQTDPQPPSGWIGGGGEIGDLCAWQGLLNTTLTTGKFATQPLWSDTANACVQHTP